MSAFATGALARCFFGSIQKFDNSVHNNTDQNTNKSNNNNDKNEQPTFNKHNDPIIYQVSKFN